MLQIVCHRPRSHSTHHTSTETGIRSGRNWCRNLLMDSTAKRHHDAMTWILSDTAVHVNTTCTSVLIFPPYSRSNRILRRGILLIDISFEPTVHSKPLPDSGEYFANSCKAKFMVRIPFSASWRDLSISDAITELVPASANIIANALAT